MTISERDHKLITDLDHLARREEGGAWDSYEIREALRFCIEHVMPLEERLDILKRSVMRGEMPEARRRWLITICDNINRRLRIACTVNNMIMRARYPNSGEDI